MPLLLRSLFCRCVSSWPRHACASSLLSSQAPSRPVIQLPCWSALSSWTDPGVMVTAVAQTQARCAPRSMLDLPSNAWRSSPPFGSRSGWDKLGQRRPAPSKTAQATITANHSGEASDDALKGWPLLGPRPARHPYLLPNLPVPAARPSASPSWRRIFSQIRLCFSYQGWLWAVRVLPGFLEPNLWLTRARPGAASHLEADRIGERWG